MIAVFVLAFNVAVLIAMSLSVSNMFLQVSAWVLAFLFTISVVQAIVVKGVNKK